MSKAVVAIGREVLGLQSVLDLGVVWVMGLGLGGSVAEVSCFVIFRVVVGVNALCCCCCCCCC